MFHNLMAVPTCQHEILVGSNDG